MKTTPSAAAQVAASPITACFVAVIGLPFSLFHAFVIRKLWVWYAVAYLNAPRLPFVAIFGLMLLLMLCRGGPAKKTGDLAEAITNLVVIDVAILLMAWAAKLVFG